MDPLKLTALDTDDLEVISAHMQDAVIRVGELKYLPAEQRFVIIANRFDWSHAGAAGGEPFRRRRTGLHFNQVRSAKAHNVRQGNDDAVVSLLSIAFEETDEPSGELTLVFSGGGQIKLDVECIEAQMSDLGPVWETNNRPEHETEGQD
jgi:hypothetical protein